jgi:recombination protein RecA
MLPALSLGWRLDRPPDVLSVCYPNGGRDFPRGRISEIVGARSSGRTSVLHALLAASTGRGEFAALVDAGDAFDPCSAAAAGVELSRLIWVRCGGRVEPAMRAADLLIQAGGFGVVALDLAEAVPRQLQRIPATAWFRFRRAVETTPTILAVVADRPLAKSCASLAVKLPPRRAVFTGRAPFLLLRDLHDAG